MLDVREQLRDYGEQLDVAMAPIRLDELATPIASQERASRTGTPPRRRLGWVYALVAAVAVLFAVGGVTWLIRGGEIVDRTLVTIPPATTVPVTEVPPSTIPITDALFPVTLGDRTIAAQWDLYGFGDDSSQRWEIISIDDSALLANGAALIMFPDVWPYGMQAGSDMWISSDGELWEPVTLPGVLSEAGDVTATVADIAVAGSRLVAVGWSEPQTQGAQQGIVWTSEDGRAWTRLPDAAVFAGADVHDVASDGSSLVAVGFHHESGGRGDTAVGRSVVWTSPDGVTWTRGEAAAMFDDSIMRDVAHGPGGYLTTGLVTPRPVGAVGMESIYWLSENGREWDRLDLPAELRDSWPYALAGGDDGYASTVIPWGENRTSWISPDGITWQLDTGTDSGAAVAEVSDALSATRIAFHTAAFDGTDGTEEGAEHYEIFLMNVDGSETTRLHQSVIGNQTLTDDSAPDWSPDGSKLVFTSLRDEVGENWNYEIYVMNADGSDQRRLTDAPGVDAFADWSPDGTRIIFEREGSNGTRDIWMMNADGTSQVNLTDDPDHDDILASWSPDGTRIAFASDRDDLPGGCEADCNVDVYVMTIDGSDLVRLTEDLANDAFPEWSPDGSRFLFHSNRAGNWDVFVMNADGTGQFNLTNTPAMDAWAVWSPDGTRIAFNSNRDGNVEIYLMDPDGANLARITNTSGLEEWWPSWSPIP